MSHSHQHGPARRATAALGALALGLLGALAVAGPASAAPNIDPDAEASLTIHKFAQPADATGLPNDGTAIDSGDLAGLTPLPGVGFTIERVTSIDLLTSAGWDAVDGLTAADVLADPVEYPVAAAGSGTTDAAGTLAFGDLELGLYLVTETGPGANPIADPIDPFLVTLPLPTGDADWLYDVHVYPKNAVTSLTKSVSSSAGLGLGSPVTWSITARVPNLAAGQDLTQFVVADTLDSRLTYASSTVSLSGTTPLVAADYGVAAPAVGANGSVTVTFTPDGLTKLEGAQGQTVTVTITTTVTAIGDGTIENQATVTTNGVSNATPTAVSNWGALDIYAYTTDGGTETGLAGGVYQVFATEADAASRSNPISVNGQTTFETGADGHILVPGLGAGTYFVRELTPPPGYQSNPDIIERDVLTGSTATPAEFPFPYTQVPAWALPLTGGDGALWFGLGGSALLVIAVGAGLTIATRRRRAEAVQAQA